MPRGGENHAQGGKKIAQGGGKNRSRGGKKIRARFARAGQYISSPPLGNFSCTPLYIYIYIYMYMIRWGGKVRCNSAAKNYLSTRPK